MPAITVVVAADPEGQVTVQLLGAVQGHGIVIKLQFLFKGGEEALYHGVVPAAALGRHSAANLGALEQLPVHPRSAMSPLNRLDQELIRFDMAVPQNPVQGLQHQRGLNGRAHGPNDHATAVRAN